MPTSEPLNQPQRSLYGRYTFVAHAGQDRQCPLANLRCPGRRLQPRQLQHVAVDAAPLTMRVMRSDDRPVERPGLRATEHQRGVLPQHDATRRPFLRTSVVSPLMLSDEPSDAHVLGPGFLWGQRCDYAGCLCATQSSGKGDVVSVLLRIDVPPTPLVPHPLRRSLPRLKVALENPTYRPVARPPGAGQIRHPFPPPYST